ncbi:MAG: HAD family phosphatase [Lachnospiraceae bacterium]|nr:HAD family phosphatase [Lachnospiraceae bacterium]
MITTIVFDIGMVLADFHWRRYIESYGYSEEVNERLAKATVQSPWWEEFDRGVMSWQEIVDSCLRIDPELSDEIQLFYENIENIITEYPYSTQWVKDLRAAGYKVYLLSNYGEVLFGRCRDKFGFLKEVDGGIISYTVKRIKPDKEIYRILLERYSIKPEEAVFLDDREENIAAAKELGMQGIVFQNKAQADAELAKLGVRGGEKA